MKALDQVIGDTLSDFAQAVGCVGSAGGEETATETITVQRRPSQLSRTPESQANSSIPPEHFLIHFPKRRDCEACERGEMQNLPSYRVHKVAKELPAPEDAIQKKTEDLDN